MHALCLWLLSFDISPRECATPLYCLPTCLKLTTILGHTTSPNLCTFHIWPSSCQMDQYTNIINNSVLRYSCCRANKKRFFQKKKSSSKVKVDFVMLFFLYVTIIGNQLMKQVFFPKNTYMAIQPVIKQAHISLRHFKLASKMHYHKNDYVT